MFSNRINISREDLYEKVWTTPMQKLAPKFGLSDVGLAKLCKRHQIPVPGRGYWARLQFGQKLKRPVLPKIVAAKIEIFVREKQQVEAKPVNPERPIPIIEVPEKHLFSHQYVIRIDKSVLRGKKDERGLPLAKQGRLLPLQVYLDSLPRALRILDILFINLDNAGLKIAWTSPYTAPLDVIVLDEKLGISLSELVERKRHKMTDEEIDRQKSGGWWSSPRWDYTRTGRLRFTLQSRETPDLQQNWADGKKQKIESCLGEIVVGFEAMAHRVKQYREDCAEAARRRAEEQRIAEEQRRLQEEYNRKLEVLNYFADQWREANRLREFRTALKESVGSPALPLQDKFAILRILDWLERHANSIDPLADVSQIIRRFDKQPSIWGHY